MKRTTSIKKENVSLPLEQLAKLQVLSAWTNRLAAGGRLGYQYEGERNIYEALGYPQLGKITYDNYAARYYRQDIAKAVINRPIQYTWKGPLVIGESGTVEETQLEKAWKELERKLKLKNKFIRLDKLTSIGTYGVLLLGFSDVKSQEGFLEPLKEAKDLELLYVKPLAEVHAKIKSYVRDTKDPRYGLPNTYTIDFSDPVDGVPDGTTSTSLTVHHSRVLHVTSEMLESEVQGVPVLESIYNRLYDLEKLIGGSAEMFWRGARPGFQGIVKDDYQLTSGVEADLQAQIDEYENNLRRFFVNEGIELKDLSPQVANPGDHVDVQIQMISAATGIPKRVLTGSERGELASGQDLTSWYSTVQSRREEHAETHILRPFIDLMIDHGVLPEPSTGEYFVEWADLFAASDKEQAEVGRIRATALREFVQNPLATSVLPPEAFMKWFLGLEPDQVEQIQKMTSEMMEEEQRLLLEQALKSTGTEAPEGQPAGKFSMNGSDDK